MKNRGQLPQADAGVVDRAAERYQRIELEELRNRRLSAAGGAHHDDDSVELLVLIEKDLQRLSTQQRQQSLRIGDVLRRALLKRIVHVLRVVAFAGRAGA